MAKSKHSERTGQPEHSFRARARSSGRFEKNGTVLPLQAACPSQFNEPARFPTPALDQGADPATSSEG